MSMFRRLPILLPVLTVIVGLAPLRSDADGMLFSNSNSWNVLYDPAPNPIPGVSDYQSRSVAMFSGNIGAAGRPNTPNNGSLFLVRSAFGHALGPISPADFLFGEEIVPEPALLVDKSQAPIIDPPARAFYITNAVSAGNQHKVFASEPGFVNVTWFQTNGTPLLVRYLISQRPVRSPVGMYHTHNPGSSLINNSPNASPQPPPVDLGSVAVTVFHFNSAIPENVSDPFLHRAGNTLFAKERTGLILIEYRNQQGQFLDVEIVAVRRSDLADALSLVDIGDQLRPNEDAASLEERPLVNRGLGLTGGEVFVYQHNAAGFPQDGDVFAIRKSLHPLGEDMEVYWRRRGVENVVWPYELHRYQADWPFNNPAKYQLYVRAALPVVGPDVEVPGNLNGQVMPFQEPAGHARMTTTTRFLADVPGFSLLKYAPANTVAFQVVRSVLNSDTAFFNLSPTASIVGAEIAEATHRGARPGYIHVPAGDRYDWEIYDGKQGDPAAFRTQQIFPVNTGLLEVWWANTNKGVQWPSLVKRYLGAWPQQPEKIIIASMRGSGVVDPATHKNFRFYAQNDSSLVGFNPNDEHALVRPFDSGEAVFALRNDLGTPQTSEPYVLLKFQVPAQSDLWRFRIFRVVAEESPFFFQYPATAGTLIQPPFPLSSLQAAVNSAGVSGPFFRDRKAAFWAKAAGNDGGTANIVMRLFYKVQPGFFFPGATPPAVGAEVPWLDLHAGTPGVPRDIGYTVNWPDNVPQLQFGETLVKPKRGLPGVGDMISAQVIYQQSVSNGTGESVKLIDPTRVRQVDLAQPPSDVQTSQSGGLTFFPTLPPHLRTNFWYDPLEHKLKFIGSFIEPVAGEYYLRLNVITARERQVLLNLSREPAFDTAVTALSASAAQALEVPPNTPFDQPLALTAGLAQGIGFVTIAENNSTNLNAPADPVALHVLRVTCPLYRGEIKAILSENPLDEKITLRHSGDFVGKADDYFFEWRTEPPVDGLPSTKPFEQWAAFIPSPASGDGAMDITIEGASLFTLSDNYFICRYRPKNTNGPCGGGFSDFTSPQLQEGWIKRVLAGINPFEQRIKDYENSEINTIVSMISQAGPRFVGSVALNLEAVNNSGLIETYETVLKRGIELSIEGSPPVNYPPATDALLLVAGRLADLYMLLGNEAFADASDPTIAFGTDDAVFGAEASSIHCFMNQTPSLIDEELALLRGRDDQLPPGVGFHPFYNRLIWNFTRDITGGEVAYALNYNVRDEQGAVDGQINEADAKRLYPQGHGDAWGHYLVAIKNYYRLLRSPHFTWVPRSEAVLVGGVPVAVDFLDERKFAAAAAAKARTGAEITSLTYRSVYTEDPAGQWQGYQDANTNRAWGVSEWSSRAGQGALFDWVVGNALLPDVDRNPGHTGIQKIDRTNVTELREIPAAFEDIQSEMDKADLGLNPLGLTRNSIPFDIAPSEIDQGKTHFEQVRDRAIRAMNNAISVFNHANNSTQLLRRQADVQSDFQRNVVEREADFNNRLIEIFGTPFPDDIGPNGAYPSGYNGPDLFHFSYVDGFEVTGITPPGSQPFTRMFVDLQVDANGGLNTTRTNTVTFDLAGDRLSFIKPASWTGRRRAPGETQRALSELLQTQVRFQKALKEYDVLLAQIEDQAELIRMQHGVNASEIRVLRNTTNELGKLNEKIKSAREEQFKQSLKARNASAFADAMAESISKVQGLASDLTGPIRGAIKIGAAILSQEFNENANEEASKELDHQLSKEHQERLANLQLTALRQGSAIAQEIARLEQVVRQEALLRLELYTLEESTQQAAANYRAVVARGLRLLEDRLRFRQQTAAQVQEFRYKDMAFRIFRNDALQKYRAQFDLAAMYVFLAAKAYDFETALASGDPRGPGEAFMTSIVRSRSLGLIQNGDPQTGGSSGDPGLADPLARMFSNWDLVLRGQLGFNNPDNLTVTLSLRNQLFRIADGAAGLPAWRQTLTSRIVPDYRDIPEVRRYCDLPLPDITEPGIVIESGANDNPFGTTVTFLLNAFGWPLGPGDFSFNPTVSATKIRAVKVIFSGYTISGSNALACSPFVYLIPVGDDVLRAPDVGTPRQWHILDQQLPVPFPLSPGNPGGLDWVPINDTLGNNLAAIRKFDLFLAAISPRPASCPDVGFTGSSRLIGRSVWNTKWMLIIPAGGLGGSTLDEGLRRFVNSVTDIAIEFRTYSYGGN
jgi:hypothetical protein